MVFIKRVYEKPELRDGFRVLVDRLWPRGVKKNEARIGLWMKDIAPSQGLREWFSHDPEKWDEFRRLYKEELENKRDLLRELESIEEERGTLTLVYAARDVERNNAIVIKEFLSGKKHAVSLSKRKE
jgi:uncharacterized protein YeaO (DUF488 family)